MSTVKAALDLAKRVLVFPCDKDKRPFTAHGFKDAGTDPDLYATQCEAAAAIMRGKP
jgi:hypothetical protein